ncbi:myosin [Salpingoeca rosetta]|uniref:Myosin n=1 Tax=Salpingoeca rosetta (strain ATCC 50818 / BSB-021) TaxID=946362 RepID=F2U9L1_SALR5|nr:myosin [Salpingoeca rosetta]EGD73038.1 myosin [Salpingoeca rosetta]|eukprot:XP_004994069.1 myosin [Salpingoeca rosetta]
MTDQVLKYLRIPASSRQGYEDSSAWAAKRLAWIPDEKEGFVLTAIKSDEGEEVTCQREDTREMVTVSADDVQKANPPKFNKVEDMAELTVLNEASVLFNLRDRYHADLIYTYSGLFCVVVNPYKNIPIYNDDAIKLYKGQKRDAVPPHVFAIADLSYRSMLQDREDQSILCTGESGAGKTENTKKVIQYLASVAATTRRDPDTLAMFASDAAAGSTMGKGELERQLLQANPILETFGNAGTIKNDNSSRFGKFIRIHFDAAGFIIGATIDTYLLEKSRCVRQNESERTFHSFYQLLRGADAKYISELLLEDISKYEFISNGDMHLHHVDDGKEFADTNEACRIMGMTDEQIMDVWRVVSAVMLIGNIEVSSQRRGGEQAVIKDDSVCQKVCHLLGINVLDFTRSLLKPKVKAGHEFVHKQQTKEQVDFAKEALAKATYERLFLWIVKRINKTLDRNIRDARTFIGILDIAGFEIFKVNSFEQLCINYTNERLQQLFNSRMFQLEQDEYQKENIDWEFIDFGLDLQPTIDLIERKGILPLLDDECFFPKATDQSFVDKVVKLLGDDEKLSKPALREDCDFAVVHYAGRVPYQAAGWLVKNKDPLNDNVTALLAKSGNAFVATLWSDMFSGSLASANRTRKGAFRTVGFIYKENLNHLMDTLNHTTPHFVRCIIPNHEKKAGKIDAPLVLDQLRCNGVLEGIRICRKGFPNRILFQEFKQRYSILVPEAIPRGFTDGRHACEKMVEALNLDAQSYRIGLTKVFFRAGILAQLEEQRDLKLSKMIIGLQAFCRGYLARRYHGALLHGSNAILVIQRNARAYMKLRSWAWWKLFTKIKPLLKVARGDEELRLLREELEDVKQQLERSELARKEAEARIETLEMEKKELNQQLEADNVALTDAEEVRSRLVSKNNELLEDLQYVEQQLDEQMSTTEKLLAEKKHLIEELEDLKKDLGTANLNEARISRLEEQLETVRKQLDDQTAANQELEEQRKKLNKELNDVRADLDQALAQKSKAQKAHKKLVSELEDATVELDHSRSQIAQLTAHQRSFDKQLNDERGRYEELAKERDALQSQNRELSTKVLTLKNELEEATDRCESTEKAKKRLQDELDDLVSSSNDAAQAELEAAKRTLQITVDEQKQQIIELEDELQLVEQAKLRLEVNMSAMEKKMKEVDQTAMEEEHKKLKQLNRQIRVLEEELENERRISSKTSAEKRKLDLEMADLKERLEEEQRGRTRDSRAVKKLEKRIALLYEEREEDSKLAESSSQEAAKLREKIKKLQAELDTAEDEVTSSMAKARRAEREAQDMQESLAVLQEENTKLRSMLRRARLRREELVGDTEQVLDTTLSESVVDDE